MRDPTGTVHVGLPAGWAFDPISSSLTHLVFTDWIRPAERQLFVQLRPTLASASSSLADWETAVRATLPDEFGRVERREPAVLLVERPGRSGRPSQRWAIVRGARLDVTVEQVGVPLGGALLTPELAVVVPALDVSLNRRLPRVPLPGASWAASMAAAHEAMADPERAAVHYEAAVATAADLWLTSLVGGASPDIAAAAAVAEAMLRLAAVSTSPLVLAEATLLLHRIEGSVAAGGEELRARVDALVDKAFALHGAAAHSDPPHNALAAMLVRSELLLAEVGRGVPTDVAIASAAAAVDAALTVVAYARRGAIVVAAPDAPVELSTQGTPSVGVANEAIERSGVIRLVSAAAVHAAARSSAGWEPDRASTANWLLAARRLAEVLPSAAAIEGLVLALNGQAGALVALGDTQAQEEAAPLLDEAEQLVEQLTEASALRAQIALNQAWLHYAGRRVDTGLPYAERALAAALAAGDRTLELGARSLRATFLSQVGRTDEAIAEAERALAAGDDPATATHELNLAVVLHHAGRPERGLHHAKAGLAKALADDPHSDTAMRLLFVAGALLASSDRALSLAASEAAASVLDVRRLYLGDAADRIGFDDAAANREIVATIVGRRLEAGDTLGALASADRHRARSLTDPRPGGPAGMPDRRHRLIDSGASLEVLIAMAGTAAAEALEALGAPRPLDGRALVEEVVASGRRTLLFHPHGDELLMFLIDPGPPTVVATAAASLSWPAILALTDELRARLGIAVAARVARGELPPQRLELLKAAFADNAADGEEDDRGLRDLGRGLHDALLGRVAPLLVEGDPLVVVPYRELTLVPLSILTDAAGRTLTDRHPVSILPSVAALRTLGTPTIGVSHAVVVGDPAADPAHGLAPLPGARVEAERTSAALAQADVATVQLYGADATERAFRASAAGARVVHLACHAALRVPASASALYLAPAPTDDGLLLPAEIGDLRLDGALVVLAACESGLGRTTADGVLGLGRAFLNAGARTVVLSLWRVGDRATQALMATLYAGLVGTAPGRDDAVDIATALARAQTTTRMHVSADASAWGAWLIIGDGGWRLA